MTRTLIGLTALMLLGVAALAPTPAAGQGAPRKEATPPVSVAATQAVTDFRKQCDAYVALHNKIESGLPKLPKDAKPEQIDQALVGLSQGIVAARAGAKPGDVFVPGAADYLRQTLVSVFSGADGKQLRASILDENPIDQPVRINGPYPDGIPLSTMPPQILSALPKLPDELEYRFVGERLILFDHHAHLIVDYVDRALPRV